MNVRTLWLTFFLVLTLPFTASVAEEKYTAGIDYELIVPPLPASEDPGKVQIVELFWYGCPHCFRLEPYLNAYLENKPEWVEFVRIPAIFSNPSWELHARAFYTAQVLGVEDTIHKPLFDALHVHKMRLNNRDALKDFFAGQGVSGDEFDKAFDSFAVLGKVNRARDLSRRYGITGVPALIVEGKYRIGAEMAVTYQNLINIAAELAEKAHKAKSGN